MPETSGLMRGKRGLIMGVANNRSIAWGIAKACHAHGAELAFTYQGDALKKRVEPLAEEVGGLVVGHCDVTEPATHRRGVRRRSNRPGARSISCVHAIAFSDKDQLDGRYVDTTADNFTKTMLISCYSFTAIAQRAEKLMPNGGSLLTLTYYGAEKWMPHYNVMGVAKAALEASVRYLAADLGVKNIRVNAISSGPIKTLAASGIGDFRYILKWNEYNTPLRRNVTIEEVGKTGVYFLSDMSRGVTGEIHHVDAGYHIVGMKHPDAPDIGGRQGRRVHRAVTRSVMPRPTVYYVRHGETDWNVDGRLQGHHDIPLNARGRAQAVHCGEILRDLFARDGRDAGRSRLRVEPARARPRDHGAGARRARPAAATAIASTRGLPRSRSATGRASPSRNCTRATRSASPQREQRQMGLRAAGRRELRADVGAHARLVRESRARHGGGRAWRHGARR